MRPQHDGSGEKKGRILFVDDEERMCESMQVLLCRTGYEVKTAVGGKEGLRCLQEGKFDLLITDLMMPGVDGFALMERVRREKLDTQVIVITGYASVDSAVTALQKGAYDFILKPYDYEVLEGAVGRTLERLKLMRRALLSERLRAITQMAVTTNHEMNSPLAVILMRLELLLSREGEHMDEDSRWAVTEIMEDAREIGRVIRRLTDISYPLVEKQPILH